VVGLWVGWYFWKKWRNSEEHYSDDGEKSDSLNG
jgi:hypothetical protein